jgi:hypothetical protein
MRRSAPSIASVVRIAMVCGSAIRRAGPISVHERVDEWPDRDVGEEGMPELGFAVDRVPVAAAMSGARDVFIGYEVGDDLLGRALSAADAISDLADPDGRVECDAQEHVAVVAEKEPTGAGGEQRADVHSSSSRLAKPRDQCEQLADIGGGAGATDRGANDRNERQRDAVHER